VVRIAKVNMDSPTCPPSKTAGKQDVAGRINIRIHRDVIGYWHNFIGNEAI
jgi:hypothetical protein